MLGAVIDTPLTVSDIARSMGITRQSVQRTADLLVADGLLTYRDNPAHRRAKLVAITDDGRAANDAIGPAHRIVADRLASILGDQRWQQALDALHDLSAALDAHPVA